MAVRHCIRPTGSVYHFHNMFARLAINPCTMTTSQCENTASASASMSLWSCLYCRSQPRNILDKVLQIHRIWSKNERITKAEILWCIGLERRCEPSFHFLNIGENHEKSRGMVSACEASGEGPHSGGPRNAARL